MWTYVDGTEVLVGDIFKSSRNDYSDEWQVSRINLDHSLDWTHLPTLIGGTKPFSNSGQTTWKLVRRGFGKKERKLSGFGKFIQRTT